MQQLEDMMSHPTLYSNHRSITTKFYFKEMRIFPKIDQHSGFIIAENNHLECQTIHNQCKMRAISICSEQSNT
ncbi:hypothetical protein HKD37_18G050232 [Glycine soja]